MNYSSFVREHIMLGTLGLPLAVSITWVEESGVAVDMLDKKADSRMVYPVDCDLSIPLTG